jgi:radical SAM protein with 4Fe4S-binding SPASM domain
MVMEFPQTVSFTITNHCNLRCTMCGQWSEKGYIKNTIESLQQNLDIADWKRLVDEIAAHQIPSVIIRGGEPFMYPGIIELLEYINSRGLFTSIDTNGTLLTKYAADLLRIGKIHITLSVDGPEEIHDRVRGGPGCFKKLQEGLALLDELEKNSPNKISRSICFTISPYSLFGLGAMPNVARQLSIKTLVIVPYNYITGTLGALYQKELREEFGCAAFSWQGFHHDSSGVDVLEFNHQIQKYRANLGDIYGYPYLALTEAEYRNWFQNATIPVKSFPCSNAEKLIDIQPNGDANFCVDTPDYRIGNVRESTVQELWNSNRAEKFREYRRKNRLGACYRCVSKYMSEIVS